MPFRKRVFWLLLLMLLCMLSAVSWQRTTKRNAVKYAQLAEQAQLILNRGITEAELLADRMMPFMKGQNLRRLPEVLPQGSTYNVFLFDGNQPLYWSGNEVWPGPSKLGSLHGSEVLFMGNGWYYAAVRKAGTRTLAVFLLVRKQYHLQNRYLNDHFNASLGLPLNSRLLAVATPGTWAFTDPHNRYLFSVEFQGANGRVMPRGIAWLYGLAFIFLYLVCFDILTRQARRHRASGFLLLILLTVTRILLLEFRIPLPLYESEFFSPRHYASGYLLNSPGDLLFTVALIFAWIIFGYTWFSFNSVNAINKHKLEVSRSLATGIIFLFIFHFSVFINFLLSGLIINSQISFNTANVFELDWYSLAGMVVSGILLLSLYLMCDAAIRYIRRTGFSLGHVVILFLGSQGLFLFILLRMRDTLMFQDYGVSAFLFTNSIVLFVSYIRGTEKRLFSFSRTVLVLVGFSLYAGQMIDSFNKTRERGKRQLLAAKLENEQDLVAEFLFDGIELKLKNDGALQQFLHDGLKEIQSKPLLRDETDSRLLRQYFGGYFNRYEIHFRYFNSNDLPVNDAGDPSWNIDNYLSRIRKEGKPATANNLWFVPEGSGKISYIGIVKPGDEHQGTLVIEMNARYLKEESGLPALLLGNRPDPQQELNNYSFARYRQGRLVTQAGNFNYYLTPAPYEYYFRGLSGMQFSEFDNYSHLFYRFGKDGMIIISMPRQGIISFITLFSYIFSFFSLSFLLVYLGIRLLRFGFSLGMNFKTRIQVTVMSIVIATLLLTGLATITYIINNYRQAQNQRIREKINNILVLIASETANRDALGNPLGDDLNYTLNELSSTLNTDFNIYNPVGILLFTSQPRIYENELLAPVMNRDALTNLTSNQKAIYIHPEKIGNLNYLAAYEHIRNSSNKTIGFVALPYFARESELNKDISGFLVALINIYVLIFSIAILLTFAISNRITQPLRIIQDSLRRIKLGRSTEPIVWNRKDEIGALVQEYNRMIAELQKSAALLAKSERESAWREMAKQVAHEIKNPLTPMRLSIQHLQRAYEDNYAGKEEMVARLSATLIEQIDTLSNIATEFSSFAIMPRPEYMTVELNSVLEHVVDLFRESSNAVITLDMPGGALHVLADKDQLVRIFSNLIKNALQSVPPGREGIIRVEVSDDFNAFTIAIKDNGCGIPNELTEKIFAPNFTTKSSGTGLGLAMVKNMVSAMNGDIWFTTVESKGSSFFVRLNKQDIS